MKKLIYSLIALMSVLSAQALEVANTAGKLSTLVTNHDVTLLTVTGTMDARDFAFISDSLTKLNKLILTNANVVAYTSKSKPVLGAVLSYADDELPVMALAGSSITGVQLPSTLRYIGEAAFAGCEKLAVVGLSEMLDSIGRYAFAGCTALTDITLPASVQSLGDGAFWRCTALTEVAVEDGSDLRYVGKGALLDCSALTTLSLGENIVTLDNSALAGAGLTSLDLSKQTKLKNIGDWAFVMSKLVNATLPEAATEVGQGAMLYMPSLTTVTLPTRMPRVSDYLFAGTAITTDPGLNSNIDTIGAYAFYDVNKIEALTLPTELEYIGDRAMAYMTGLKGLYEHAIVVPALGEAVWEGVDQPSVPLYVLAAYVDDYKAAAQWKEFLVKGGMLIGDVNGDGEVNVADVNALITIILGSRTEDDYPGVADVNGDKEINVSDVNAVIAIILGSTGNGYIYNGPVQTTDNLRMDDLSIRPGEVRTVEIYLDNVKDYSALQFDIELPDGLELASDVEPAARAKDHISRQATVNNVTRALLYSMQLTNFEGNEGAVVTLQVRATSALAPESEILLYNTVLADNDAVGYHTAATKARVFNATDIADLDAAATDKVWAAGDVLHIQTETAGTAQVVNMHGMTRELAVEAGHTQCTLDAGFYIVHLNGKSYKIAIR